MNSRLVLATVASLSLGLVFVTLTLPSQAETITVIGSAGATALRRKLHGMGTEARRAAPHCD